VSSKADVPVFTGFPAILEDTHRVLAKLSFGEITRCVLAKKGLVLEDTHRVLILICNFLVVFLDYVPSIFRVLHFFKILGTWSRI